MIFGARVKILKFKQEWSEIEIEIELFFTTLESCNIIVGNIFIQILFYLDHLNNL